MAIDEGLINIVDYRLKLYPITIKCLRECSISTLVIKVLYISINLESQVSKYRCKFSIDSNRHL